MIAPVAILAGGLATRLRPITETIPKSLVDVCGEPFIAHQLKLLRANGIDDVVLCVGFLGEQIAQVVGPGTAFGLRVRYAFDGEQLLGTGGAVRRALAMLGDEFFVLYGDSYLLCDYRAVLSSFRASGKLALMTVFRNEGQYDTSNVEYEAGTIRRYDKSERTSAMHHIDYGLGVFRREAFADLPEGVRLDLAKLYQTLLAKGQVAGYEVKERFYEIGSVAGLEEFRLLTETRRAAMTFTDQFLDEACAVVRGLDRSKIEALVDALASMRERGGRLFILGVGGSAANASHAVNDFRKLTGMEAYAPTDNVSELTARTNDEGWESVFAAWLRTSRLQAADMILVLSVGGGDLDKNVSPNLVAALNYAKQVGATVGGIVGRDGGYTAKVADACVVVPTVNAAHVTPHTEAFQAVVWHLLVSHPKLKAASTKWEGLR